MTELNELGLSSYEEQVYRTLLVTGAATATELSTASDVPKGRIYDVLNGLEARQLVRTHATDPTRYAAVDPSEAVAQLLAERAVELRDEWARYRSIAGTVRSDLLPTPPVDASVWLGRLGGEAMQTALQQHVRTATTAVRAAVGPPYEHAAWETLRREFDAFFDGVADDVTVSLLLSDPLLDVVPDTFPALLRAQAADVRVRVRPTVPVSYDVIDGTVTTVDIPHPRNTAERIGVFAVTADSVVDAFDRQFRQSWDAATPLLE